MTYRLLAQDEWNKLESVVPKEFIPNSQVSAAAIAEDDNGNILGCLFMQLAMHMEPLVLTTPKVSFVRLYETLYNAVEKDKGLVFYCFSDKEIVDGMAEHLGMTQLPYKIFKGEVR